MRRFFPATLRALTVSLSFSAGCGSPPPPASPVVVAVPAPSVQTSDAPPTGVDAAPQAMRFEMFEVNDTADPWSDPSTPFAREDIRIEQESGLEWSTHFAEISLRSGESMDAAKARLAAFVRGFALPAGNFFGFQKSFDTNPERRGEARGWRTFVLQGAAVLTDEHLQAAELRRNADLPDGYELHLNFNEAGGRLLAELTERCLRRRIAIVIDGVVQSAPVVMARIEGGRAQVWLADRPIAEIPDRFASGVSIERP